MRPSRVLLVVLSSLGILLPAVRADYTLTTLASFNGRNGASPSGPLAFDARGNIYGTAHNQGFQSAGLVYSLAAGTHTPTPVFDFAVGIGQYGSSPAGGVVLDTQGNLYGTTTQHGFAPGGTVFRLSPSASGVNIATLAQFPAALTPTTALTVDTQGNVYGTASGAEGSIVFRIAAGTSVATTVATFTAAAGPLSGLTLDSQGNLYGTTSGSVFRLAAGTNALTMVADLGGAVGANGVVLDSRGNLFGTTSFGGTGGGTVFKVAAGTGTLTTLATFGGATRGYGPAAGLAIDAMGNLFGTTYFTSNGQGAGTIFEVAAGTGTLATLASFDGTDGLNPAAPLTLDAAGNLYGTTLGGTNNSGTIFELVNNAAAVPEPPALLACGQAALIGLAWTARSRGRRARGMAG